MLRAADLVYEHGFTCFAVVNDSNSTSVESFTTTGNARKVGTVQIYGNMPYYSSHTTYTPGQTYTFYKPQAALPV